MNTSLRFIRLGWTRVDLEQGTQKDPEEVALAAWLRRGTMFTIKDLAARLHLVSWKSATPRLSQLDRKEESDNTTPLS